MPLYYLETSALVKLYVREPGTDELLRLASSARDHRMAILGISKVEFRSAIRKRQRIGDIEEALAEKVIERFEGHVQTRYVCQILDNSVLDLAASLIDRHGLRAYDSVQLAGCLALRNLTTEDGLTFVCADRDLVKAAEMEGLKVLNPTHDVRG